MLEDGGCSLGFASAQPQRTLKKLKLHIDVAKRRNMKVSKCWPLKDSNSKTKPTVTRRL